MKKEEFDKLSLENRMQYIKMLQGVASESVYKRMEILPLTSSLSVMLLIIATFGDGIIPYNNLTKIILSILLLIIPMSLFLYNSDLKGSQNKSFKYIGELLDLNIKEESEKDRTKFSKLVGNFPDYVIYLLAIIIVVIIILIWTKN